MRRTGKEQHQERAHADDEPGDKKDDKVGQNLGGRVFPPGDGQADDEGQSLLFALIDGGGAGYAQTPIVENAGFEKRSSPFKVPSHTLHSGQ